MILPGVDIDRVRRRARRRRRRRRAERAAPAPARGAAAAVHARARLPARPGAQRRRAAARVGSAGEHLRGGQLRLGAAGGAPGRSREHLPRGDLRNERRRHLHAARRPANRSPSGRRRPDRCPRDHLPRDRRARAPGAPPGDAGRERIQHGPLARRRHARADRMGDRPLLADGGEPGRDPARLERGHPRVSLGGQGERPAHGVLRSRGLRSHRARTRHGHRPPRRRRLEPRQPALGRGRGGDPDRQPHRGREAARTPAIARSSPTASTSRERSSCSHSRSSSSGLRRSGRSVATCGRGVTAAATTRSCAARCA